MTQTAEILEALPPAQMQPTGLAQFDLAVTATPLVINWNRDAVSALLDATLEQYEKLVVQEEDVLTYAMFPQVAPKFFEKRSLKRSGVDGDHVNFADKTHPV